MFMFASIFLPLFVWLYLYYYYYSDARDLELFVSMPIAYILGFLFYYGC